MKHLANCAQKASLGGAKCTSRNYVIKVFHLAFQQFDPHENHWIICTLLTETVYLLSGVKMHLGQQNPVVDGLSLKELGDSVLVEIESRRKGLPFLKHVEYRIVSKVNLICTYVILYSLYNMNYFIPL